MIFAIKIPVPDAVQQQSWGDYHFAKGIQKALVARGHVCCIDLIPDWYAKKKIDIVIVLRGLGRYKPQSCHFTIMWNISHPAVVSDAEYDSFDLICVASLSYSGVLAKRLGRPVVPLLQCTDPELFYPINMKKDKQLLFVGNSRKVFRQIIKDLHISEGQLCPYDLHVYGKNWEQFLPASYVKGEYTPYETLREMYSSCDVLLNDHWQDMKENNFVSNRIFDALACKTVIVSDYVQEIKDLFGTSVVLYTSAEDLPTVLDQALAAAPDVQAGYEAVLAHHTFAHRVDTLLQAIAGHPMKTGGWWQRARRFF